MHQPAACNCSHSQTEPEKQGIISTPISFVPDVATRHVGSLVSFRRIHFVPTFLWLFLSLSRQTARDWTQPQGPECLARAAEHQSISSTNLPLETWRVRPML